MDTRTVLMYIFLFGYVYGLLFTSIRLLWGSGWGIYNFRIIIVSQARDPLNCALLFFKFPEQPTKKYQHLKLKAHTSLFHIFPRVQ